MRWWDTPLDAWDYYRRLAAKKEALAAVHWAHTKKTRGRGPRFELPSVPTHASEFRRKPPGRGRHTLAFNQDDPSSLAHLSALYTPPIIVDQIRRGRPTCQTVYPSPTPKHGRPPHPAHVLGLVGRWIIHHWRPGLSDGWEVVRLWRFCAEQQPGHERDAEASDEVQIDGGLARDT
jgi:hypothetical protein